MDELAESPLPSVISGSMEKKIPTTLYEIVEAECTIPQITGLLRDLKDEGYDVKTTGATKAELVRHVRAAVDARIVDEAKVLDFAREHEESGNQHIFFFHPKDAKSETIIRDGERMGRMLLGELLTNGNLPRYSPEPKTYVWADFRIATAGDSWTAKVYGHQERTRFSREVVRRSTVIRYYTKTERRIVCIIRWNGAELEVRISRVGAGAGGLLQADRGESEIDKRLKTVWELASGANLRDLVQPWDLKAARMVMVQAVLDAEEESNGEEGDDESLPFVASSVRFRDSAFGSAEFNAHQELEGLASAEDRKTAMRAFLDDGGSHCRQLVAAWDADVASGLWGEKSLRTVVGGRHSNELAIASSVNPGTVEYVTDWLRWYAG